ncbi:MAG: hypothetical protein ACE5EV_02405 [Gaiellales bacterium]
MTLETVPFIEFPHSRERAPQWWAENVSTRFRVDGPTIDSAEDSFWVHRSRAWLDEWRYWVARQGGSLAVPYINYRWDTSIDLPARVPAGAIASVPVGQVVADVARVRDNGFDFRITEILLTRLTSAVLAGRQPAEPGRWPVFYCRAHAAAAGTPGQVEAYKVVLDPLSMVDVAVEHCLRLCELIGVRAIQLTCKRGSMAPVVTPGGSRGIHHLLAGTVRPDGSPEAHVLSVPPWEPGHYEAAYQRFLLAMRYERIDVVKLELPGAGGTAEWLGPDLAGWVREPGRPYAVA